MKLSAITTFTLFAGIFASPLALEKRAGATDTLTTIINTLETSVTSSTTNINNLVVGVNNNVDASLQIVGDLNLNFEGIRIALQTAAASTVGTINPLVNGIGGAGIGYTSKQVAQLVASLNQVRDIFNDINASIALTATNLTPDALALVQKEVAAVSQALMPFTTPLTGFANAVLAARVVLRLAVTGLQDAIGGVRGIVANTLMSLVK